MPTIHRGVKKMATIETRCQREQHSPDGTDCYDGCSKPAPAQVRPGLKGCTHRQIRWEPKVHRYICAYCGAIQKAPRRAKERAA